MRALGVASGVALAAALAFAPAGRADEEEPAAPPAENGTVKDESGFGDDGVSRSAVRDYKAAGGTEAARQAVQHALTWLAAHHPMHRTWDSDGFASMCQGDACSGPGAADYDIAQTGAALLCFLGAGETHISGYRKNNVRRGLRYLKAVQDSEGCVGPRTAAQYQKNHVLAALALTEAYRRTGSRLYKSAATRAVEFSLASQTPYLGWRYGVQDGESDTEMTAWNALLVRTAQSAEFDVDPTSWKGTRRWLEKVTDTDSGRATYMLRGGDTSVPAEAASLPLPGREAMTAAALATRGFARDDFHENATIAAAADLLASTLPRQSDEHDLDHGYVFWGSAALRLHGKRQWKEWNDALKTTVIGAQCTDDSTHAFGSWDPPRDDADRGGRIWATTMSCLALSVYTHPEFSANDTR